jgi:hypothetical protein
LHCRVALENLIGTKKGVRRKIRTEKRTGREIGTEKGAGREKGVGREIGTGVKIVDIEMMWIAKETEETGIGTGTTSVTAAMIGKGERLVMFCKSLNFFNVDYYILIFKYGDFLLRHCYRLLKLDHVYFDRTSLHFNLFGCDLYVISLTSYCVMNVNVVVIMTKT